MLSLGMARSVSIVGAGRLGRTLGRNLRHLGWRINAVVTRSKATARAAVRAIGAGEPHSTLTRDVMDADVILLVTPDDALAAVARKLATLAGKSCRGRVVLHASGALDSSILRPLARCGASTGSIHPMQTFTRNSQPDLKGVIFAVEGDARARRTAATIARAVGRHSGPGRKPPQACLPRGGDDARGPRARPHGKRDASAHQNRILRASTPSRLYCR